MRSFILAALVSAVLLACGGAPEAEPVAERAPMTGADFRAMMQPVPKTAVLDVDGWEDWGASMVRTDDGACHLYFAQWPSETGHGGWLSDSVISYATADNPLGPYAYKGVIMKGSGGDRWDAEMVHNPTIKRFDGKYYLYHIGTRKTETFDDYGRKGVFQDNHDTRPDELRNRRSNQRTGVAIADSPEGPWQRFDKPLIEAEPGTVHHYFNVNPSVVQTPEGDYLMVFKCMDSNSRVVHGVARADNPEGPFRVYPDPVFTAGEDIFAAEDPYIWYADGFYYAILKDFKGSFTKKGLSLALFVSGDGVKWRPADDPFITVPEIHWADGTVEEFARLERPQLWLDGGRPAVLFCAAYAKTDKRSFNVHIPLR